MATGRNQLMRWPMLTDVRAGAESLYAASTPMPLWVRDGRATPAARAFVAALRQEESRGSTAGL